MATFTRWDLVARAGRLYTDVTRKEDWHLLHWLKTAIRCSMGRYVVEVSDVCPAAKKTQLSLIIFFSQPKESSCS